jgi:ABC-type glycerol-3-phosphate transport system permease component
VGEGDSVGLRHERRFDRLGSACHLEGGAMAASIVTSVPIILAFTLLQRFFVQGLTAGAVKS